jgi:hypothetical protein
METIAALDAAGHRRSPATMPGYHQGRPPRNKGMRYPADPPDPSIDRTKHGAAISCSRPASSCCFVSRSGEVPGPCWRRRRVDVRGSV